jgi:hypothetical protein
LSEQARSKLQGWAASNPCDLDGLIHGVALDSTFEEVLPGLHVGRPFCSEWHTALSDMVDKRIELAAHAGHRVVPPNSMNRYGAILDDLGFEPLMTHVVKHVVEPLAGHVFPEVSACGLDGHHAFVVDYSPETDDHLSWHMDDAEVTLNLCLGTEFNGGDLVFRGRRCPWHRDSPWENHEVFQYAHQPGAVLIHAGTHRHEALPVTSGFRRNLIIWCTSGCYRERTGHTCPTWCPDHRPTWSKPYS